MRSFAIEEPGSPVPALYATLLMSNNVSELAIIRKGILKELFLPRIAFLRGRNFVLGFCVWTIRISCYRSRERATEHIIRDFLARNFFVEAKGG